MTEILDNNTLPRSTARIRINGLTISIYKNTLYFNKPLGSMLEGKKVTFGFHKNELYMWVDVAGFEVNLKKTSYKYHLAHTALANRIRTVTGQRRFVATEFEPLKFKLNPIQ